MANWEDLPIELVSEILSRLNARDLKSTSLVYSQLRIQSQQLLFDQIVIGKRSYAYANSSSQPNHPLVLFLCDLLATRESFVRTNKLTVIVPYHYKAYRDNNDDGWLIEWRKYKAVQEKANTVGASSSSKREETSNNKNEALLLKHGAMLERCGRGVGVPEHFVTRFPLSAALIIILHLLPKVRHLDISNANATIDTLTLAVYGHDLVGPTPSCLQKLTRLHLEEIARHCVWVDTPLPLVCALPELRVFEATGWGSNDFWGTPGSNLYFLRQARFGDDGSRSNPNLFSLIFNEAVIMSQNIAELISITSNLKLLEYRQRLFDRNGDSNRGTNFEHNFDCKTVSEALKPHSHSLETLKIMWQTSPDPVETNDEPLFRAGTFNDLNEFTALRHLVIPAHLLFGDRGELNEWPEDVDDGEEVQDLGEAFKSRLPSSLETLEIQLVLGWHVDAFLDKFRILEEWTSVKANIFLHLEEFTLHREACVGAYGEDDPEHLEELEERLAEVKIKLVVTEVEEAETYLQESGHNSSEED